MKNDRKQNIAFARLKWRSLWRGDEFNQQDGLNEYDEDFSQSEVKENTMGETGKDVDKKHA